MSPRPERPSDAEYYERDRVELLSQGDLFRDVPLAYPLPADEIVVDEAKGGGSRRFLSGPLEFGPAMLITPSCSLGAQGAAGYGHPVRTLVPVIPLARARRARHRQGDDARGPSALRPPDQLHVPAAARRRRARVLDAGERRAPVHAGDAPPRIPRGPARLAARLPGAQQLQRKLVWFYSGGSRTT